QFSSSYFSRNKHYKTEMSESYDANAVKTFPDHVSFYQHRSKADLVSFLTSSTVQKRFSLKDDLSQSVSVTQELDNVCGRLLDKGFEVIVVDCTPHFLKEFGLHAVKVLIPGLQPLNAGHRNRTLGGRRVFTVARLMGLADRDKAIDDLNPWPHPF